MPVLLNTLLMLLQFSPFRACIMELGAKQIVYIAKVLPISVVVVLVVVFLHLFLVVLFHLGLHLIYVLYL